MVLRATSTLSAEPHNHGTEDRTAQAQPARAFLRPRQRLQSLQADRLQPQKFYEIHRNFQTCNADGLIDRLPGRCDPHPNRVPEAVVQAILEHGLAHPCHGPMRVAQELVLRGIQVSSASPDLKTAA
jgi:hypothetical protein